MGKLLAPLAVLLLVAGAGAVVGWKAHPDGVEQRHFHGVVVTVNSSQTAIAVRTTEYGKVAGPLVHDGRPLKAGQTVDGLLLGPVDPDSPIVQVDPE